MSDDDLLKKREGTFITGLPDFHLIQLQVLVLVESNVYWNGERTNPLLLIHPI
jgi:hypothetical protein